jgi:mRNA interferase MazF
VVALMRRGEVWAARLNPNQGAEVGKDRPVVVIQADALTEAGLATLVVVPLTSQRRRGAGALRVAIPARDRLLRECWAMAEQPRALDRNRIDEGPLTRLSAAEMNALEQALRAALGLAGGRRPSAFLLLLPLQTIAGPQPSRTANNAQAVAPAEGFREAVGPGGRRVRPGRLATQPRARRHRFQAGPQQNGRMTRIPVHTFSAVIERCPETGMLVGYVPGFPGAHSQAETLDELQSNLQEVIAMLLEDGEPTLESDFIGLQQISVPA